MKEDEVEFTNANGDNVMWNIYIIETAGHIIHLSTGQVKDAILMNGRDNLPYPTVVYTNVEYNKNKDSTSAYLCVYKPTNEVNLYTKEEATKTLSIDSSLTSTEYIEDQTNFITFRWQIIKPNYKIIL